MSIHVEKETGRVHERFLASALALTVFFLANPLVAEDDNVITTIKEALAQYQKGDYSDAASNLNYAAQLVMQKKSERMKSVLPPPPAGWQGKEPHSQALGAEFLGGGLTASRTYERGESSVHLEVLADSPALQSVLMMTSNSVLASAGGGKLEKVKGYNAVVKYSEDERKGEIYVVVGERFLIAIKGKHIAREELELFAKIMDYGKLLHD